MEVKFRDTTAERVKTDLLVIPVREKKLEGPEIRALDRCLKGNLRTRIEKSRFTGAEGSALLCASVGMLPAAQILLLGLGGGSEIAAETWRKAGARARKEAAATGAEEIAFLFSPDKDAESVAGTIVEGALLAAYQFNKYRSNTKSPAEVKSLVLFKSGLSRTAALQRSIDTAQNIIPGVYLARDLINEPPSVTTARFLGEQAGRQCRGRGLSMEV